LSKPGERAFHRIAPVEALSPLKDVETADSDCVCLPVEVRYIDADLDALHMSEAAGCCIGVQEPGRQDGGSDAHDAISPAAAQLAVARGARRSSRGPPERE